MKQFDPFHGAGEAHVDVMGGAFQLQYGRFLPLVQHHIPGKEETDKPHAKEQKAHRQQEKENQALLQALYLGEIHGDLRRKN
jgi:hypothetical protein